MTRPAVARPSYLGDYDRLVGVLRLEFVDALDHEINRPPDGYAFPVGQYVYREVVDVLDQIRIFFPDMPGFRGADGNLDPAAHLVEILDQLRLRDIATQQHFIADDDAHHIALVLVRDLQQLADFALVLLQACIDPGAQSDIDAVFGRQGRNLGQRSLQRIGAHGVGFALQQDEVLLDFLKRRVFPQHRVVVRTHGRERKPLDHLRPGRFGIRAVDPGPQTDGERRDRHSDGDVDTVHERGVCPVSRLTAAHLHAGGVSLSAHGCRSCMDNGT